MINHYLRVTKEATYNGGPKSSPTAAEQVWIDYGDQSPNIGHTPVTFQHSSVVPDHGLTPRITGADAYNVAGQVSTRLFHEQAAFWKESVLQPTFASGYGDLPSYSIDRVIRTNAGTFIKDRYNGCKFNQATVSGSNQPNAAIIQVSASIVGGQHVSGEALAGFATTPECATFPTKLYRWKHHTMTLGVLSLDDWIRSWSVTVSHRLSPRRNKPAYVTSMGWNGWTPTIQGSWDLKDKTLHDKFLSILTSYDAAKYDTTTLNLDRGDGNEIDFVFGNVVISALQTQTPPGADFTQNGTLTPHFECGETFLTVTVTDAT